jgi:hypothetical protein
MSAPRLPQERLRRGQQIVPNDEPKLKRIQSYRTRPIWREKMCANVLLFTNFWQRLFRPPMAPPSSLFAAKLTMDYRSQTP